MKSGDAGGELIAGSSDALRSAAPLQYARSITFTEPLELELGDRLPEVTVVYETYGTLNAEKSNAVLVCHALSGDSHVARHDPDDSSGWWDIAVGPGKAIDTDRFFVICPNVLGGCRGTTGPNSINPATGRHYAASFPDVTIEDTVELHRRLLDHLAIPRLHAVIGGSMGGQQALAWATRYPERVAACILLASAARLSNQALAFDVVARNAILHDPNYCGGDYYENPPGPTVGLAIARMLGHLTYLSQEAMEAKFEPNRLQPRDVKTSFEKRFSVGAYLAHQGDKFVERFDANSYATLSLAMDLFDLGDSPEALSEAFAPTSCRWLVISYSSDWLFPSHQSRQIVRALIRENKRVSSCEVQSYSGHDSFLLQDSLHVYGALMSGFLAGGDGDAPEAPAPAGLEPGAIETCPINRAAQTPRTTPPNAPAADSHAEAQPIFNGNRPDHAAIIELIPPGSSVLDLGCGNGELLWRLARAGRGRHVGVELEPDAVIACVERGLDVIHADAGNFLYAFGDYQFDVVVLSQALQIIPDTERILDQVVRIGRRAIVSFPNFAYRSMREMFYRFGRSPKMEGHLGFEWYNTPNRRFASIDDVEDLCLRLGIDIIRRICIDSEQHRFVEDDPNLNATEAIFVLVRDSG
jgi:homoserine O-acetyltransferase